MTGASDVEREALERAARKLKVEGMRRNPMHDDVSIALNAEPTYEEVQLVKRAADALGFSDLLLENVALRERVAHLQALADKFVWEETDGEKPVPHGEQR